MKTISKAFQILSFLFLIGIAKSTHAQTCTATFTAIPGANGLVTLVYTGMFPNNTNFYWSSNGVITYTGSGSNGNGTMTTQNYTANGIYTITLLVQKISPTCSATTSQTINITNASGCLLNANFSSTYGGAGLVNFVSTSSGTTAGCSYSWNYGDGSTGSGALSSHTYTNNGIYNVKLLATNSATCTSLDSMNVSVCLNPITPSFTYAFGAGGQVTFTSTSAPVTTATPYYWNFNNNTQNSTYTAIGSPTAITTFTANGTYTVALVLWSGNPSCQVATSQYVTVNNVCALNANFSVGGSGAVHTFYGSSPGTNSTTTYSWAFGDGGTGTGSTPTHTYANNGLYTVTLTIANTGTCNATSTYTANVNVCLATANANFSIAPTATAQYWNAIPTSPANVTSAQWSWGDGSVSNTLYTSHQYSAAGTYTLCLTVTVSCAVSSYCNSYYIFRSGESADQSMINVSVVNPNTINGIVNSAIQQVAFAIHPNPSNGEFTVNMNGLKSDQVKISVYNLIGNLMYESNEETTNGNLVKEINMSQLANGVYFVKVNAENKQFTKKIVLNR